MKMFLQTLTFKKMISPFILQFLFWVGIGGTLYGTYVLIKLDNWAWIFAITMGPLVVRVIFERAILAFQTYDCLGDIHAALVQNAETVK